MKNKRRRIFEKAQRIKNSELQHLREKLERREKQREQSFTKKLKDQKHKLQSKSVKRQLHQEQCQQEYQKKCESIDYKSFSSYKQNVKETEEAVRGQIANDIKNAK